MEKVWTHSLKINKTPAKIEWKILEEWQQVKPNWITNYVKVHNLLNFACVFISGPDHEQKFWSKNQATRYHWFPVVMSLPGNIFICRKIISWEYTFCPALHSIFLAYTRWDNFVCSHCLYLFENRQHETVAHCYHLFFKLDTILIISWCGIPSKLISLLHHIEHLYDLLTRTWITLLLYFDWTLTCYFLWTL